MSPRIIAGEKNVPDQELAARMTLEEHEKYTVEERARMLAEFIKNRKKQLAVERAEAIRSKPPTKSQLRNLMMTYLKNTGRFTHAQLKHRDFEEIQGLYNKEKELVDTFVPIGSEEDERRIKDLNTKAEEESSNKDVDSTNKRKKRIRMKRSSKKQKTDADLKEEEQLKTFLSIVPNEEEAIDYEVLDKRYQIVDWKSEFYHNDRYGEPHDYYRVFRADGSSRYIKTFTEMVSRFDRMDFLELHSLVMQRFETTTPEGIDLILWGDLKTMFEANAVDELWKNQEDWILKSWNLYENCGVHILMLEDGTEFHMLAERKYPLTKETLEKMLVLRLTAESESEAAFDLLRLVLLVEDFAAAEVLKNLLQVVSAVRVNINTVFVSLKSHDCHIMMQHLLPYELQQYLPDEVAKPIIELCLFFKQICSTTLMGDDMLKAQSKVVNILCNLELIYPLAFFDIMIHLVIHLPLEALEGGPIRPRWMFPFERFMKKLKGYVRNKAKPEGSIAEGYVAEEALTFSSHYFRDVTTKFNRPDRNVDPPPPTCQFQVFRSLCKSIGLRSVIRFDAQELKKVIWYVLHNSPEIDTYRSQFKSKFPNKDMKEEFPDWFGSQIRQRHVDNDPGVSATSELFALACGPTPTPISVNSCVVNGVRFVVHSRDERRTTQNSGICSPGGKDGEMYYGQLQEILEFSYLSFKVVLFRVKWFDTSNEGRKVKHLVLRNNMTQILTKGEAFKDDQYILATQVKQCFYLEDMARRQPHWKVVEHVNHKKFSDGGVIVVEEDPDVIHFDNSSDLPLSTSLNDLNNATLHIDGQSTEVDAPPDIIDLDEDDDIIDDEDALPHDLADSDDEDLVNVEDDDGVEVMSADVARGHGGNGGGDDRPPTHHIPTVCRGCFVNRGKGTRKPNLGGRKAGRLHTRQETRNLRLKKITDDKGPVPIRFEWDDKKTMMPLGEHASHWSNYLGELIREMPLYYPSW
ncbi:hypothetical protein Tco_0800951 [Tanacetum coccineum]|uniref:DUF4218 domain-containing protein n=1 Tax=Tanacetum coccineum TaxID=301880 RepID=A0ABQ4ZZ08_9ASTR